jgi:hypothetical protein
MDRAQAAKTTKVAKKAEPRSQDFTLPDTVMPGRQPARKRKSWKTVNRIQQAAHAEVFRKFVSKAVAKAVVEG